MHTFDLSMEHVTKVEGAAALNVKVENNKVKELQFKIIEYKRFYTQAIQGQNINALPQMLSRICGTCSNAHLLCAIEACEDALNITPSTQTMWLRLLTMYGLMIRDHGLHLYLFSLPDIFNKDSFLEFDEDNSEEHQLLHDGFEVKAAGNFLSTLVAGRSVHGLFPTIGGYIHLPDEDGIREAIKKLTTIRPAVLRLIKVFQKAPFHFDHQTNFMAMIPERYGFLKGVIKTSQGATIAEKDFRHHLEHVVIPYSQASAYKHKHEPYMVGALARMNLAKSSLNIRTQESLKDVLTVFPSTDIFHNNLAQAIEILHAIDDSIDILKSTKFVAEPVQTGAPSESIGVGVIEAPRGTLYHKITIGADGKVKEGEIVVPTGQNQVNIEEDIWRLIEDLLPKMDKHTIAHEIEKLIRAYDPCLSCASHFLKVNWR